MTMTEDELIWALDQELDDDGKEIFKRIIITVAKAMLEREPVEGVLLLRTGTNMLILPINADEMIATDLLHAGVDHMYEIVTHDAPDKAAFN